MIIDIEKLNPGTWFPMEDGGEVCVRVCAGDDAAAIRTQAVKVKSELVFHPKTGVGQRIREEIVDEQLQAALLWDFCIVDWRNLYDAKQQPIPCNRETKALLMGKVPRFFAFVTDCLRKLRAVEEAEAEALEKN